MPIHRDAIETLTNAGFSYSDAVDLRRISMTLRRWFEHECNGAIQRDESGKPFAYNTDSGRRLGPVPDREAGAGKRLEAIMSRYPDFRHYIQGDPRGASLYIMRPGDVPEGADVGSYYTRGLVVY